MKWDRVIAICLSMLMSACGGGGGGATEVSPGVVSGGTGLSVSFSASSLSFSYLERQLPLVQHMSASASGTTDQPIYLGAIVTGQGIATPINVVINTDKRTADISIMPVAGLAAGTYTGTIQMLACTNQECTRQHAGSPYMVAYTVTVAPVIHATPAQANLAAPEGLLSAALPLIVSLPAGVAADKLSASVSYKGGASGWLSVQASGTSLSLSALAKGLAPGTYLADVNLSTGDALTTNVVPVNFVVSSGLSVAAGTTMTLDNTTPASALRGFTSIALAPGVNSLGWTAASDQDWLKLDTASGIYGGALTWHVDPALVASLPNNAMSSAAITVSNGGVSTPVKYVLKLDKAMVEVADVDAVALLEGQAGDVLVFGDGFDKLANVANSVLVDGVPKGTAVKVNSRLLRLTLPATTAGDYALAIAAGAGVTPAAAILHVKTPQAFAYQAIDRSGSVENVVWDPVGKQAFTLEAAGSAIVQWKFVNGRFQAAARLTGEDVTAIGLSRDYRTLIAQGNGATSVKIRKLATSDLSTVATYELSATEHSANYGIYKQALPVMADSRLLQPRVGGVDLKAGSAFKPVLPTDVDPFLHAGWAAVSGDGVRMLWPDSGSGSPSSPMVAYSLVDGVYRTPRNAALAPFFYRYSANHDGSRWLLENKVVDFDLNVLGTINVPTNYIDSGGALSRLGSRVYVYTQNSDGPLKARIYAFDISVSANGGNYPILGFFDLDDKPNCPMPLNFESTLGCAPFSTRIILTDDDQTLLLVGDRKFMTVLVPSNLRAPR